MELKLYQVDAFSGKIFSGNPAAVCPLEKWLPDEVMQNIAMENNLAETAFYVKEKEGYHIRWFTPALEVDLCGHATLASAYVLFNYGGFDGERIEFRSRSGLLTVARKGELLTLNFPVDLIHEVALSKELLAGFDILPLKAFKGKTDYMLVFEDENQILNIQVDFSKVAKLVARGIIITAPGKLADFVSRFFAPQAGIDEDPVTGSAHTTLVPYWANTLNKQTLSARQLSKRGGELTCTLKGDRVEISGKAKLFLKGTVFLE